MRLMECFIVVVVGVHAQAPELIKRQPYDFKADIWVRRRPCAHRFSRCGSVGCLALVFNA